MKVLFVNTIYPPDIIGGAEVSVSLLAEAVAAQGCEVTVVSLHPKNAQQVDTLNGVKVYRVPLDNLYWPFGAMHKPSAIDRLRWHINDTWNRRAAARFGAILDSERPDVVHSNNITGLSVSIWAEVKKRGIRLVHTLRDYSLLCKRSTLFTKGNTCQTRCTLCATMTASYKRMSGVADAVASNSQYVLDQHLRYGYFPDVANRVIFNIANFEDVPARQPDQDLVFGYIGRIEDEKGIEVVLNATRRLPPHGWRLNIAGRGVESYVDRLKTAYDDPRIDWLGFAKSKDFYSGIDVCLISSVWPEPLPRTLIESIAAGRSTICSTAGGIPEIAELSSLIGIYEPRDDERLAALMTAAIADADRWRTPRPATDTFKRLFSPTTIAGSYRELYEGHDKSSVKR